MRRGRLRGIILGAGVYAALLAVVPVLIISYLVFAGTLSLTQFGTLAGTAATAAASLTVAAATYLLVQKTGEMAEASVALTRLTEAEHRLKQPIFRLTGGSYAREESGGMVTEAAILEVANIGEVEGRVEAIALVWLEEDLEVHSNDPFLISPGDPPDHELLIEPGEVVRIQANFDRMKNKETRPQPATEVAIVVKPLGFEEAAPVEFPYPPMGEERIIMDKLPVSVYSAKTNTAYGT